MKARVIVSVILPGLLLLSAACQTATDSDQVQVGMPAVKMLFASQQCGYDQATPRATWIDDARQLEASIRQIQRNMPVGKALDLPKLDFTRELVLLIEMGQKPTLGYRIALGEAETFIVENDQSQLVLDWVTPAAGSIVAQAVSSPCLLLALERGDYHSVQVLNRQGTVMAGTH